MVASWSVGAFWIGLSWIQVIVSKAIRSREGGALGRLGQLQVFLLRHESPQFLEHELDGTGAWPTIENIHVLPIHWSVRRDETVRRGKNVLEINQSYFAQPTNHLSFHCIVSPQVSIWLTQTPDVQIPEAAAQQNLTTLAAALWTSEENIKFPWVSLNKLQKAIKFQSLN